MSQTVLPGSVLRPAEAAKFLGVCTQSLYRWASEGRIAKPIKIGPRSSGWKLSELQAFLDAQEQKSRGGTA